MSRFAVTLEHGPAWNGSRGLREQEQWTEHATFMDALVDEGFVILGGPLADGDHVLLIIEAQDDRTIRARLAEDPWATADLLRIMEIQGWEILLDAAGSG